MRQFMYLHSSNDYVASNMVQVTDPNLFLNLMLADFICSWGMEGGHYCGEDLHNSSCHETDREQRKLFHTCTGLWLSFRMSSTEPIYIMAILTMVLDQFRQYHRAYA